MCCVFPPRFFRSVFILFCLLAGVGAVLDVVAAGRGEEDSQAVAELRRRLVPEDLSWSYAVGVVVAEEYTDAHRPQLGSFVRIVADAIGGAPVRYLSSGERLRLAERIIQEEERRLVRRIDERRELLDRRYLTSSARDPINPHAEDAQLHALRQELRILGMVEPDQLSLPETATLHPVDDEHRYRRVLQTPAALAGELDVDTLLYLTVVPLDELLFLRVHSYDSLSGRTREIVRLIGSAEDMPRLLEAADTLLVGEVAAREPAGLIVTVSDEKGMPDDSARIRLNGELLGVGRLDERFLPPGEYSLSVVTGDGREVRETIELDGGERRTLAITLPSITRAVVRIESDPPGAHVYEGALWSGMTPLEIFRPAQPREYTISMKGHYDSRVQLGPDSPDRVHRSLVPTETDWYASVTNSRDRFYRSFGAFALSLSVPILINGMYNNLGGLFPGGVARSDLTEAEEDAYLARADRLLMGYYVGVGLSTTLFANMVWRVVQYVRTAQEYHDR